MSVSQTNKWVSQQKVNRLFFNLLIISNFNPEIMLCELIAPTWCVSGQVSALSRAYGDRTIFAYSGANRAVRRFADAGTDIAITDLSPGTRRTP